MSLDTFFDTFFDTSFDASFDIFPVGDDLKKFTDVIVVNVIVPFVMYKPCPQLAFLFL